MENRIITMDNLVAFCQANKIFSFSAKEVGHPLVVSTFGEMQSSETGNEGLMQVILKSCHTGLNRNGSFISDEDMTNALPSFANKPILAEIVEDENGELDFGTHAMEFKENEDGDIKIHYIEKPVGIIPETNNIHLEYDKKEKKTYVKVNGYIFEYYGNEAADILKRKNGTKVSVELEIYEMSWNAKENYLAINDFSFSGVTLLGEKVGEGMIGSRLDIADFSHYESLDYSKEINEMKSKLQELEQRFLYNSKEGGNQVNKFEELLAQYGKTVEDIDFEYEGLSDEELEAKFAEVFADDDDTPSNDGDTSKDGSEDDKSDDSKGETTPTRGDTSGDGDGDGDEDGLTIPLGQRDDDDTATGKNAENMSEFALSLQEKINALSNLVSVTYEEADNEWYGTLVYNDYVVMLGYFSGRSYKQNYKEDNDEFTLVGDRVQVFAQYLTQEEIDELEQMRKDFSVLKEFKENTEKAEFEQNQKALLEDEKFSIIADTEAYKTLVQEASKYTLEELENKLKLIVADFALGSGNFSVNPQKSGLMFGNPNRQNPIETNYGGIFEENK